MRFTGSHAMRLRPASDLPTLPGLRSLRTVVRAAEIPSRAVASRLKRVTRQSLSGSVPDNGLPTVH